MGSDASVAAAADAPGGPASPRDAGSVPSNEIQRLLRAARDHLDMEVAFVSQLVEADRVFRFVDQDPGECLLTAGAADPLEESYCHYVVSGGVPQFLADPLQHPVTAQLPVTTDLPVGTHLSVPIQFSDGRVYGTFCCFSRHVDPDIDEHDLRAVRMLAEIAAEHLEAVEAADAEIDRRRQVIRTVIDSPSSMAIVFQPIVELGTMEVVGLEALARFQRHDVGPDWYFEEAEQVGLGLELEMKAVCLALEALDHVPAYARLNLNVSPSTAVSDEFHAAVATVPPHRIVVEVTEHAAVDDYDEMRQACQRLRELGVRLAVDDVGMGFSGLNQILEVGPDELKLDRNVVRDVDTDVVRQALIEGFGSFATRAKVHLIAEGIETEQELDTLRQLGVRFGQGFFLARPMPLTDVYEACTRLRQRAPKRAGTPHAIPLPTAVSGGS